MKIFYIILEFQIFLVSVTNYEFNHKLPYKLYMILRYIFLGATVVVFLVARTSFGMFSLFIMSVVRCSRNWQH